MCVVFEGGRGDVVEFGGGLDADAVVVVLAVAACAQTTCLEVGENVPYQFAKARGVESLKVGCVAEQIIVRVDGASRQRSFIIVFIVFLEPFVCHHQSISQLVLLSLLLVEKSLFGCR